MTWQVPPAKRVVRGDIDLDLPLLMPNEEAP